MGGIEEDPPADALAGVVTKLPLLQPLALSSELGRGAVRVAAACPTMVACVKLDSAGLQLSGQESDDG
jgi:hypothetical protein